MGAQQHFGACLTLSTCLSEGDMLCGTECPSALEGGWAQTSQQLQRLRGWCCEGHLFIQQTFAQNLLVPGLVLGGADQHSHSPVLLGLTVQCWDRPVPRWQWLRVAITTSWLASRHKFSPFLPGLPFYSCTSLPSLLVHSRTSLQLSPAFPLHQNLSLFWMIPISMKSYQNLSHFLCSGIGPFLITPPQFTQHSKRGLFILALLPHPLVPNPIGLPPPPCHPNHSGHQ